MTYTGSRGHSAACAGFLVARMRRLPLPVLRYAMRTRAANELGCDGQYRVGACKVCSWMGFSGGGGGGGVG